MLLFLVTNSDKSADWLQDKKISLPQQITIFYLFYRSKTEPVWLLGPVRRWDQIRTSPVCTKITDFIEYSGNIEI